MVVTDERTAGVSFTDTEIIVNLQDGRTIAAPLAWYPKLLKASWAERIHWEPCAGGYGVHWPELDEDLSVEGWLGAAPAPQK